MKRILITGATGNVGREVINQLSANNQGFAVQAAVRNEAAAKSFVATSKIEPVLFDFEERASVAKAMQQTDILFLLRPPALTDVNKYFAPVIAAAKANELTHIVFLSVQGAEANSMIPHHKIEKLITASGISYTFLRPAYFMQNFTTTLRDDIVTEDEIYLPAGEAKFTVVDLADVGKVAASVLTNTEEHLNKAYALTNDERLTFQEMADMLSWQLKRKITFKSPNLISFFWRKKKEGITTGFILVMILLHYLPRFSAAPPTTNWVRKITGKGPHTFEEFVSRHLSLFRKPQ